MASWVLSCKNCFKVLSLDETGVTSAGSGCHPFIPGQGKRGFGQTIQPFYSLLSIPLASFERVFSASSAVLD